MTKYYVMKITRNDIPNLPSTKETLLAIFIRKSDAIHCCRQLQKLDSNNMYKVEEIK